MHQLEHKTTKLELEQDLKQKTKELRLAITDLERATIGYRDFRHRFISTYYV